MKRSNYEETEVNVALQGCIDFAQETKIANNKLNKKALQSPTNGFFKAVARKYIIGSISPGDAALKQIGNIKNLWRYTIQSVCTHMSHYDGLDNAAKNLVHAQQYYHNVGKVMQHCSNARSILNIVLKESVAAANGGSVDNHLYDTFAMSLKETSEAVEVLHVNNKQNEEALSVPSFPSLSEQKALHKLSHNFPYANYDVSVKDVHASYVTEEGIVGVSSVVKEYAEVLGSLNVDLSFEEARASVCVDNAYNHFSSVLGKDIQSISSQATTEQAEKFRALLEDIKHVAGSIIRDNPESLAVMQEHFLPSHIAVPNMGVDSSIDRPAPLLDTVQRPSVSFIDVIDLKRYCK